MFPCPVGIITFIVKLINGYHAQSTFHCLLTRTQTPVISLVTQRLHKDQQLKYFNVFQIKAQTTELLITKSNDVISFQQESSWQLVDGRNLRIILNACLFIYWGLRAQ